MTDSQPLQVLLLNKADGSIYRAYSFDGVSGSPYALLRDDVLYDENYSILYATLLMSSGYYGLLSVY